MASQMKGATTAQNAARNAFLESPNVPPTPPQGAARRPQLQPTSPALPTPPPKPAAAPPTRIEAAIKPAPQPVPQLAPAPAPSLSSPGRVRPPPQGRGKPPVATPPSKPTRGSLSEQLARISQQSDNFITGMKQSLIPDPAAAARTAKLMIFGKKFIVGHLESLASSPVQFYEDKCTYAFHHPRDGRVDMEMFYKDLASLLIHDAKFTFSFRLLKPLQYFKSYNPTKEKDRLSMTFTSQKDYTSFKARMYPVILAAAKR